MWKSIKHDNRVRLSALSRGVFTTRDKVLFVVRQREKNHILNRRWQASVLPWQWNITSPSIYGLPGATCSRFVTLKIPRAPHVSFRTHTKQRAFPSNMPFFCKNRWRRFSRLRDRSVAIIELIVTRLRTYLDNEYYEKREWRVIGLLRKFYMLPIWA